MRNAYHGRAGGREQEADMREPFERLEITPLEIVDAGDPGEYLGYVKAHGRGSVVERDSPLGAAYSFERG